MSHSTVEISDRASPDVRSESGAALTEPTWTEPQSLAYSATDRGGGLFQTLVEVDGNVVKSYPVTSDDRCVDRGGRDFGYAVPCPLQASSTISIDPADLPAGNHKVGLYVEDAAGNRTAIMPPTERTIVNDLRSVGYFAGGRFFNPRFSRPRVANGDGATSGAQLSARFVRRVGHGRKRHTVSSTARTTSFSQRPTIKGTLAAPSGEPIRNATIFFGQQVEGGQWRLDGATTTDVAGRYAFQPKGRQPSRALRAVYFPYSDSHESTLSAVLALRVRAGITLATDRRSARNGQRVGFTGRVLGAIPAGGVAITLQAKVGRTYRSFRQLRATAATGGRFRTTYRFERTQRSVRYRFRAKVVKQAGLPFATGASRTVIVSVRP